jgi:uncharacterized repeat protein (TIGR01451 family)
MKKTFFSFLLLSCLLCFGMAPALAQQNQKVVFPNPANYFSSAGGGVTPTSDGGYLLLSSVDGTDWNTFGMLVQPRAIKLNANLDTEWDQIYIPFSPPYGEFAFPQGRAFELPDGDFIVGLHNDSSDVHVLRINADGSLDAEISFPGLYERFAEVLDLMPNGNVLVYLQANTPSIRHLDNANNEVYSKTIDFQGIEGSPIVLANGDLLFHKFNYSQLTRTDPSGNVIWQIQPAPGIIYQHKVALPAGGFGLSYFNLQTNTWRLRLYDDNGTETGVTVPLPLVGQVNNLSAYADGTLLAGGTSATNRGYLMRFDLDGTLLWSAESPEDGQPPLTGLQGTPTADGWAVGGGSTNTDQTGFLRVSENTGFFVNTLTGNVLKDNDENCIADAGEPAIAHARITAGNGLETFTTFTDGQGEYTLALPSGDFSLLAEPDAYFFFQCPGAANMVSFAPNINGNATLDLPIQSLDLIHEIKGKVSFDQDADCQSAPDDPAAALWDVYLGFGTDIIHLKTNNAGEYSVFVPSGDYTLTLSPWNHNYGICGNAERSISLAGTDPLQQTEDYSVFPEILCPEMQVNIAGNNVRPCSTRVVSVYYRNQGTVIAEDAAVTVTLDPALEYVEATPAPASVDGNTIVFALGDLPPSPSAGGQQEIKITVLANCDLQIGQQVCISATASPAAPCEHPSGWQGAIVAVEGECSSTSDSIHFKIKNIGNGPNLSPLEFIIAEDQIVLLQGTFQLPAGGEVEHSVLPMFDSTTVSIVAQQEPGAPGDTIVSFSLTNCIGMNGGSPGGLGWNSGPYSDNTCLLVVNSYDPNDKTAYPIGYGEQNLVRPGTPLDYTIRFQNTGNDTAFLVILRDTLSDKLDRGSIRMLGASHPYELAQISDSILHIRFDNILLPDSTTNPEGSQGYISFRINPAPELPNGTQVHNRAAIYFDQNPPIITNTVTRTYGEYFVVSTDAPVSPDALQVGIFPNPFVSQTVFQLPGHTNAENCQLEIFDIAGRVWRRQTFQGNQCILKRESLEAGLYFWRILQDGKAVASGKIIAER